MDKLLASVRALHRHNRDLLAKYKALVLDVAGARELLRHEADAAF